MRKRWYVGLAGGKLEPFASAERPTEASHGAKYGAVTGPFRTKRGAEHMARVGLNNPHCVTVADAERLAAQREAQSMLAREYLSKL